MSETVKIERMGYGADAIAHASDGKTLFVKDAVPGDVVQVDITENKKTYAKARISNIEMPSPDRVKKLPLDAIQSGATWANLSYGLQLESKRANVADALRKNAKLDPEQIQSCLKEIVACEQEWGYRNKIELSAFRDYSKRFCLGSHEFEGKGEIPLKETPLANRLIEDAPKALTGVLRYLQGSDDLGIFRVGVRASLRTKQVEVALWTPPSSFPRNFAAKSIKDAIGATSVVRILAHPGSARRVKKVEVLSGSGHWQEKMGWRALSGDFAGSIDHGSPAFEDITSQNGDISQKDVTTSALYCYSVSAPSFFQVNTKQAEALVGIVLDALSVEPGMKVADLYSGVGTFTLPLAGIGADVSAIEIVGSSTRDLVKNAEMAGLDIEVICDDASIALPKLGRIDAMVVDPPRCGLEADVIDSIAKAQVECLAYVSCDPQTFARDVRRLLDRGYALESVTPVDMFPQTYHVESVGVFSKH